MSTSYPASLDSLTNPTATDSQDAVPHADQHANANDAIEALEAKVGVDGSTVATSLDYKLTNSSSSNPGHKHTAAAVTDFDTEVSNNTDVAANTTHRSSDGKDHSDVVLNNTHRTSDGSDHTFIDQDVTSGSSPVFDGSNFTGLPAAVSVTTKGDLQGYDTAPARLPVGTDDQALFADSSEATGLKWKAASATSHVIEETPSGLINSSNTSYSLANTPVSGSVRLYQNGVRLDVGDDYTISGSTITMTTAPTTGDKLLADYMTSVGDFTTGSTSFVYNETPSGTVDGSNKAFDTANTYVAGTIQVYRDGQLMKGGGADYAETDSNTITFTTAPTSGSVILVSYQQSVSTVGNADTLDGSHLSALTLNTATDVSGNSWVVDEDDMSSDSATKVPTQQSVKAYVDSGWAYANETWTYASATAIIIPAGGLTKYAKGDKIKLTQTTVKYFYITDVADTLLTITGGDDYTLANSAISDNYYSRVSNPIGFPGYFDWTTTLTGGGSMTVSVDSTRMKRFSMTGNRVFFRLVIQFTTSGTADNYVTFTLPIDKRGISGRTITSGCGIYDGGDMSGFFRDQDTSTDEMIVIKYDRSNWGIGSTKFIQTQGFYDI